MEITPTTTAQTSAAASTREGDQAVNEIAGDFETFLTLLTTQMRNQDPLKPMESTEFVAQLANFSGVEQQVRTNDRLDEIFELLSGGAAEGLAAWIGREVRAPAKADFAGAPVDVEVAPHTDADSAVLVVKNDFGQVVARHGIEPGATRLAWDGIGDDGVEVPYGRYAFEVESRKGEELISTDPGRIYAQVTEVRLEDGGPMLVTANGDQVPLAEITAVR